MFRNLFIDNIIGIFAPVIPASFLSPQVLAPHTHVIQSITISGKNNYGNIYTIDAENSRWSLHIKRPEEVEYPKMIRRLSQRGMF